MSVKITAATPFDCERIMKLVGRQYGSLNYDRTLYDEAKLFDVIKTGKYKFWLAVYEGTDIGIVCLKEHPHFIGTYEGCTLSVLPEFRGKGIAAKLMDTMREAFKEFEILAASSVFYSVLTTSSVEQTREYQNGFIPTGLALDRFLFDQNALNVKTETLPERRHHIFMVKPLQKRVTAKLFIPPAIEDFVKGIYERLNVQIGDGEIVPQKGKIISYPENLYTEVFGCEYTDKCENNGGSANIYLDMTDKRCPALYEELIKGGWKFTGLKPLQKSAEYIIMHRGEITAALDKTITLTEFDDIKEKIRSMGNV